MGSKPKAPKAPDYAALQKEQLAQNQQLWNQQQQANRPNQNNPYGSVSWTKDANGNWTQTETWDPKIKENMDAILQKQKDSISGITNFNPYEMTTGKFNPMTSFKYGSMNEDGTPAGGDFNSQDFADAFTQNLLARVKPQQDIDRSSMETKLRQQGLQPGTEAYDRAYKNLLTSQGDVNSQAALSGMLAAGNEARANYNTSLGYDAAASANNLQNYMAPIQGANGVASLAQGVYRPQYQQFMGAGQAQGVDTVAGAQQQYAQQMQDYNQKAASKSGKGSSIGSLVGTGVGAMFGGPIGAGLGSSIGGAAGGAIFSDPVLKSDILDLSDEACYNKMVELVPVGWKWNGTNIHDMGINAAQVESMFPHLIQYVNGVRAVNYSGLFAILLGAFRHLAKKESSHVVV